MAQDTTPVWFPLFEFQDWTYQSTLVLPTADETAAAPGAVVTARKWAAGTLALGQAFTAQDGGYSLGGQLMFPQGFGLEVSAKGFLRSASSPATFEATGIGTEGIPKGTVYELVGWVFPEEPIVNNAARVLCVRGSVRAVRGPDSSPTKELGGMPLGTVGSFVIARAK